MRRYAEEVRRSHGLEMQARVGLNSGEVVVRSISNDLHMDYSAVGQTTHLAAQALAEQALTLARAHQERGNQAYALHRLGDIAARCDPPEGEPAVAYYRQAITLAEALGMRPLQAHCRRGLGALYCHMGRGAEARAALSTAIQLYRAMDMTFWLPQAEAVLAQVGVVD